jgi:signal transduction histidine kinase
MGHMRMRVWRTDHSARATFEGRFVARLDCWLRCAAPLLLLLTCLFAAVEVVKSEDVVFQIGVARRIETKLSATFISVHTIKSRELEYLLTGVDLYLEHVENDRAQVSANFADLRRQLADDADQFNRLITFQADAEDLLGTMSQAVLSFKAGDREGVREWLSSPAFVRLMSNNSIGSGDLLKIERARITRLQDRRVEAFTRALVSVFAVVAGLAAYAAWRLALMSSHLRQQKLTLKTLERARRIAEEARIAAEEASRAKSDFLACVSHELRTPLNAILGFSELITIQLLGPLGHPRYGEYAADINKSGRHLLELVNDILDLSRLSAGKAQLRESDFAVDALIKDCVSLLGAEAMSHLTLEIDTTEGLPLVHADFRMIKQILLNLLSNAAKFTPRGGRITVSASHIDGEGILISIVDTGIGMTPKDVEIALSPFGQIDSKIARRHKGAGLGLPIARAHAELHDGRLMVTSAKGQGTHVTLVLPEVRLRSRLPAVVA